jgi:hypothetical protein
MRGDIAELPMRRDGVHLWLVPRNLLHKILLQLLVMMQELVERFISRRGQRTGGLHGLRFLPDPLPQNLARNRRILAGEKVFGMLVRQDQHPVVVCLKMLLLAVWIGLLVGGIEPRHATHIVMRSHRHYKSNFVFKLRTRRRHQ